MKRKLKQEINKLKNKKHVDGKILEKFLGRLETDSKLLRCEGAVDHYCVFFLPFHQNSKSIYIGHHIKADDWIPPGGHIEKDEHPLETIKREALEELDHQLTDEKIILYDLTIKPIDRPECKTHWDLWYVILFDQIKEFSFDPKEFHQADWHKLDEGLRKVKTKNYKTTMSKLAHLSLHFF